MSTLLAKPVIKGHLLYAMIWKYPRSLMNFCLLYYFFTSIWKASFELSVLLIQY